MVHHKEQENLRRYSQAGVGRDSSLPRSAAPSGKNAHTPFY